MIDASFLMRCDTCQGGQLAAASRLMGKIKGYHLYSCPECRLIYIFPKPNPDDLSNFYIDYHERSDQYELSHKGELPLFLAVLELLKSHGAAGDLLDIGSSYGHFLALARTHGFRVKGLDIAPEPCRYAREVLHLDVECQTLLEACFPENHFSAITLLNVLEHVPDPQWVLEKSWRLARPGAFLVLVVPNFLLAYPYFRLTQNLGLDLPVPTSAYDVPDHLSIFGAKSLRFMLEASGWSLISLTNAPVIQNPSAIKSLMKTGVKALGDLLFWLTAGRLVYGYSLLALSCKLKD